MQTITDNPLVSPYTIEVASGVGFGAALSIVLGVGVIPGVGKYFVSVNAVGKLTLLKRLAGILKPQGTILLDGRDVRTISEKEINPNPAK